MLKRTAQYLSHKKIKINSNCEICGGNNRLERHHKDYDKPLEVIILCRKCHKEWHKNNKSINGDNGNKKYFLLTMNAKLYSQLLRYSKHNDLSVNQSARKAIKMFVDEQENRKAGETK